MTKKQRVALDKFYAFLKKEKCYKKFFDAAKAGNLKIRSVEEFEKGDYHSIDFINSPFIWSDSVEGHTYWSKLDDKWIELNTKKK